MLSSSLGARPRLGQDAANTTQKGRQPVKNAAVSALKEVYSSLCYKHLTVTGTHVPYGITQCYLPPGRGDIPATSRHWVIM